MVFNFEPKPRNPGRKSPQSRWPAPRPRATAFLFAGLLVLAALAPLALAAPGDRRDARADHPGPLERAENRMDSERRSSRGNQTDVGFSASGMDRDNRSYELRGAGNLLCRSRENATSGAEQIHCRGRLNATILDANGTLVKGGSVQVLLHAHQNETGAWKWHMMSVGLGKRAHAVLALRGATAEQDGAQLTLSDGSGGILAKKQDQEPRLRLRLDDAGVVLATA